MSVGSGTPRCRSCNRPLHGKSMLCRSRKCPEYSHIWAGDQRQKLFRNLEAFGRHVLISAVTAPGADELSWDEVRCAELGHHRHDGRLGCRVEERFANPFNRNAPDAWRRLHRRAYQETVKRCGRGSVVLLARVWEIRAPGVLHVHRSWATRRAVQMAGARAYLMRLAELAPHYGFGFVHSKRKLVKAMPAQNAAAYLSSYFVKGKRGKTALWESVQSGAMPRSFSTRLTLETGCTMRNLRIERALFVVWRASLPFTEVRTVAMLLAGFPGSELVPAGLEDRGPPSPPVSSKGQ